jgi:hypothetical protein
MQTTQNLKVYRQTLRDKGIPDREIDALFQEAFGQMEKKKAVEERKTGFEHYADDPVGFGRVILGESYTDDVIKVMESVRDSQITVARSANAVGKTHIAARIAMYWFLTRLESKVYTAAAPPIDNLKNLLWGEIWGIIDRHRAIFKGYDTFSMRVSRSKNQFITGVAIPTSGTAEQRESKFAGKHAAYLLFIVDEGDAVPPEVYKGIESCMSGGEARLLIMFNPRMQTGPVWNLERDRRANVVELSADRHPNVFLGKNVIPGAVTREVTARRYNEWTRPLIDGESCMGDCVEVPEHMIGIEAKSTGGHTYQPLVPGQRKITDPAFSYMVLGKYPPQAENQLISLAWIMEARRRWDNYVRVNGEIPPMGVQPIMGLDVAEFGVDFNCVIFRYDYFVPKPKLWNGVDTDITARKALELARQRRPTVVQIDGTGVGSGIAPRISRDGKADGLRAFSVLADSKPHPLVTAEQGEFWRRRDQLWWMCREWLRNESGNAMLPPDDYLIEELATPTYDYFHDKIRIMPKPLMRDKLDRSPDRAEALILTFNPQNRAKILPLIEPQGL